MQLVNIHNHFRDIYLFKRDNEGNLHIEIDNSFYPFFYEPDEKGQYIGYDGRKLRKVVCQSPFDVYGQRTGESYSADVVYTINYLTHKVDKLEKCPFKYFFIDVEMLSDELPDHKNPKFPISCITLHNSFGKSLVTWYIEDYEGTIEEREKKLYKDLIDYIKKEQPDLLLAWNVDFDYPYLYSRYSHIYELGDGKKSNFAIQISPVQQYRRGDVKYINYPAGISVIDYLTMFKKVYKAEQSYQLDRVAQKHLKDDEWGKTDFSKASEHVKSKNINDVMRMVKLEEKYNLLDYYNEIRLFSKCLWEDVTANSRVIDSIVLSEAKRKKVVLPSKIGDRESESFEGAYRRADAGVFENIYKADLSSAYPNMMINFCLDPSNIVSESGNDTKEVDGVQFKQNQEAILPYLAKGLIDQKNQLKKQLKETDLNSPEHKHIQKKYDAYKGLVNSLFGITAFRSFRLYDNRVASAITYLGRELLHYIEDRMKTLGHNVIYTDTDSIFYESGKDMTELMNELVVDWGRNKYEKQVEITIEGEGKFEKLLILGKCHYYGIITNDKGTKTEIKGIEMKRSSSSKYEAEFQEELIKHILNKEPKEKVIEWINSEKERIKDLPLINIGFPCKKTNKKYLNTPIFVKALANTNKYKPFNVNSGDLYYYIFVKNFGREINVLAFDEKNNNFIDKHDIDWKEIERRSIDSKANRIFEALGWDVLELTNQTTLF